MNQAAILKQYKAHTGTLTGGEHYKRIGHNMVDVFKGEGFGTPTRYRLTKGDWTYVTGPVLPSYITACLPV